MTATKKAELMVALDLPTISEAEQIISALKGIPVIFKIGYQLMSIGGFELAQKLVADNTGVFLDLKLHDIGATVERGVKSVTTLGADFLTVHAEPDVLAGAVAGRGDNTRLKILAVTVLTSLDQAALGKMGIDIPLTDLVLKRAEFAAKAGADGVVASAQEAALIKREFGDALEIVTPGIRPAGADANDQKRVVTPADAIAAGANYLVVGRPIVQHDNPNAAAQQILAQMS